MEITRQELINLLSEEEKSPFVYIVMETIVRMNKTGNPYHDQVKKVTKGNFYLGGEYQKRVNNQRKKEGIEEPFISEQPKGKERINRCLLIDTKTHTKYYLSLEYFKETPPHSVTYSFEGNMVEKQMFEHFMVKSYKPQSQGTERSVNIITPLLSNIKEIHINGMEYEIQQEIPIVVE